MTIQGMAPRGIPKLISRRGVRRQTQSKWPFRILMLMIVLWIVAGSLYVILEIGLENVGAP